MEKLTFVQIEKNNEGHFNDATKLWVPFLNELDSHNSKTRTTDEILDNLRKRVNIQGQRKDMHFEICYLDSQPVGIANFAVDLGGIKGILEAGYGFIMGYYILPEFRRQGYGREMLNHIEKVFRSHGVKQLYTSPDPIIGEPFWSSMGFTDSGKIDPDDKLPIYIKSIEKQPIITIAVSEYLTEDMLNEIVGFRWPDNQARYNDMVNMISGYKWFAEHFNVIAKNEKDEIIGYAAFIRNEKNQKRWIYADLGVRTDYRRMGIAKRIVNTGIEYLSNKNATELITTVAPDNIISLALQKSLDHWNFEKYSKDETLIPPHSKFKQLPTEKSMTAFDAVLSFFKTVANKGYVAIDFYDGSIMYDFENDITTICDIDFYRKSPYINIMGKMWGSSRFMSPEEYELNATIDEITNVYTLGAVAHMMFGDEHDRSAEKWQASDELFEVATKATSKDKVKRYQSINDFISAWGKAIKSNIIYKQLFSSDLFSDMLLNFNRYQEVKKSYRKIDGKYTVVPNEYIENWNDDIKREIVNVDFMEVINSGGCLFGAFYCDNLIGFSNFDGRFIGSNKQYIQLIQMHVSCEYRNIGIGKQLFKLCADAAHQKGGRKLYISANSSVESQAFYRAVGCTESEEIIQKLFEKEPFDVHMEYVL